MVYIGRKIYFDKITGDVLVDTGERFGDTRELEVEEEIEIYKELSKRNRDSFDYIRFDFGQFKEEFLECSNYRVNVNNGEIEFDYSGGLEEPIYNSSFSQEMNEMREKLEQQDRVIEELMFEIIPSLVGGGA